MIEVEVPLKDIDEALWKIESWAGAIRKALLQNKAVLPESITVEVEPGDQLHTVKCPPPRPDADDPANV